MLGRGKEPRAPKAARVGWGVGDSGSAGGGGSGCWVEAMGVPGLVMTPGTGGMRIGRGAMRTSDGSKPLSTNV